MNQAATGKSGFAEADFAIGFAESKVLQDEMCIVSRPGGWDPEDMVSAISCKERLEASFRVVPPTLFTYNDGLLHKNRNRLSFLHSFHHCNKH